MLPVPISFNDSGYDNPEGAAWLNNYNSSQNGGGSEGSGGGDFWGAWTAAVNAGHTGSIADFSDQYDANQRSATTRGTMTIQTGWMDWYSQVTNKDGSHKGPIRYINSTPIYSTVSIAQTRGVNMANTGVLPLSVALGAALSELTEVALVSLTRTAAVLSLLTLQGDTRHLENPVMPGPYTTERGIPWKPNVTEMNNKNYFNDGGPDWLKWIIWGAGGAAAGKAIRDNWQIPSIPPATTTTNKATEIAPTPFYKRSK
jgi:hypothetical protein